MVIKFATLIAAILYTILYAANYIAKTHGSFSYDGLLYILRIFPTVILQLVFTFIYFNKNDRKSGLISLLIAVLWIVPGMVKVNFLPECGLVCTLAILIISSIEIFRCARQSKLK